MGDSPAGDPPRPCSVLTVVRRCSRVPVLTPWLLHLARSRCGGAQFWRSVADSTRSVRNEVFAPRAPLRRGGVPPGVLRLLLGECGWMQSPNQEGACQTRSEGAQIGLIPCCGSFRHTPVSTGSGGGGASSVATGGSLLVVAGGGGGSGGRNLPTQGGNGGTPDGTAGGTGGTLGGSPGGGGGGGTAGAGGTGGAGAVAGACTGQAGGTRGGFSGATVGTGGAGGNYSGCGTSFVVSGGGGGYFGGGGGGASATTAGAAGGGAVVGAAVSPPPRERAPRTAPRRSERPAPTAR